LHHVTQNILENPMLNLRTTVIALVCFGIAGCAGRSGEVVKDGLIGAGGGAIVGAIVPGVSTGEGAAIGGVGGVVYGLLKDRRGNTIHKDDQGNKYWIDKKGRRRYY
jgi:hypothetical protein